MAQIAQELTSLLSSLHLGSLCCLLLWGQFTALRQTLLQRTKNDNDSRQEGAFGRSNGYEAGVPMDLHVKLVDWHG